MNHSNCDTDSGWPDSERFPYNYAKSSVGSIIENDLRRSKNPLIITGYASLEKIIDFLADCYSSWQSNPDAFDRIRILLGNEPYPTKAQEFPSSHNFSQDIEDYWMDQGISIRKCGKVIAAIELLKTEIVETRIAKEKPIHAKIFQGDSAITIGSSNYSTSGLSYQIEANVRFKNSKKEKPRFDESCSFAEQIWNLGRFYNDELIHLLTRLLSYETWQVTLARACAELLEGEWAKKYKPTNYGSDKPLLWPSQEQGIAQAIWVSENVGSVLIADATGSGKTRMGVHLIKGVINHIWGTGRMRKGGPVLICPPKVQNSWEKEFSNCDCNFKVYSHGSLSSATSRKHRDLIDVIRRGQVLAVDEAHNFFNDSSNRTQALFSNMADYVLLFTATPINKGVKDLLSIVELLGADNFDDELLESLKLLWKQREQLNERMPKELSNNLRKAIQQFTVRRTKDMFNSMIDIEPKRYKNNLDALCRYPEEKSKDYDCGETDGDRNLAQQIRQATNRLRGLVYLKEISQLPEFLRKQGCVEEKYLEVRLKSAKVLAAYQVMACLRSSRAALIEHIYGTDRAQKHFNIYPTTKIKAKDTGNLIKTLEKISAKPPENKLDVELPEWLSDPARYKEACEEEIEVYTDIANLCEKISDSREKTKAAHLVELLNHHKLMIAFDSRLITLYQIKHFLGGQGVETPIATGDKTTDCNLVNELFKLGSEESKVIGLCSDAMSEGVNLQQASAVVQLTIPSVIRLAEQRIGRIARMDSPHPEIEVWWPKDSNEFALRSSESKFVARYNLVSDLLGSNISLPDNLSPEEDTVSSDEVIASKAELVKNEGQKASEIWTLGDVFDPVRSLVEGDLGLIPCEVYDRARASKIRTSLSIVQTKDQPWAFFAIAGTEWGSPRWVYFAPSERKPRTDLDYISNKLKENLDAEIQDLPLKTASIWLKDFLFQLNKAEKEMLPKKKQRALKLMEEVLKQYKHKSVQDEDRERAELVDKLLSMLNEEQSRENNPNMEVELSKLHVDLSLLAEWWLDLIQSRWLERLQEPRSEPLRLKDLYQNLIEERIHTEQLQGGLNVPSVKPIEERIVAAIIGVY